MAEFSTPVRGANVVSFVRSIRPPVEQTNAVSPNSQQLSLEFDEPHQLLVVVTDQLHGATFLRWLLQARPKVIVDFRFAPHFNFTAVDSLTVKRQIEAVGTRYVRYSVPFHEFGPSLLRHDPMAIATKLSSFVRGSGRSRWPIMVLVKEGAVASAFSPYLVGALSKDPGGKWSAEVLT